MYNVKLVSMVVFIYAAFSLLIFIDDVVFTELKLYQVARIVARLEFVKQKDTVIESARLLHHNLFTSVHSFYILTILYGGHFCLKTVDN